jgi:hypothetical protein
MKRNRKIYHQETIDGLTAQVIKAYGTYNIRLHNEHEYIVERGPFYSVEKAVADIPHFVAKQSEAKARTGCYVAE